jgi:hypothetical protein
MVSSQQDLAPLLGGGWESQEISKSGVLAAWAGVQIRKARFVMNRAFVIFRLGFAGD